MGKRILKEIKYLFKNTQKRVVEWKFEPRHSSSRTHIFC
jgi:hypothetical protein